MQGNTLLESFDGIDLSKAALFEEPRITIIEPKLFEEPKSNYAFSDESKADIRQLISEYL